MIMLVTLSNTRECARGGPWSPTDSDKATKSGTPLGAKRGLDDSTGRLGMVHATLQLPCVEQPTICFRCAANKTDIPYTGMGLTALWRERRYTATEFWTRFKAQGLVPNPLFFLPGFTLDMLGIDLLHAGDLGVAQTLLGNVLWEYLHHKDCKGKNQRERIAFMWSKLKSHYQAFETTKRMQTLTKDMIKQDKKPPKLRAKGAETRGCLPWGLEVALEMAESTPCAHTKTVVQCISRLMDLYVLMGVGPFQPALARDAVRKFCVLYGALSKEADENGHTDVWRAKPKFHMLQELGEYQVIILGNPRNVLEHMLTRTLLVGLLPWPALEGGSKLPPQLPRTCSIGTRH